MDLVEARPTIPNQRAFIAVRDGMETMIIESVLDAPTGDYAWVIPVPAVPTEIKPATTGTLKSLEALTPPEIVSEGNPLTLFLWVYAIALAAIALTAPMRMARSRHRSLQLIIESALSGCLLFAFFLLFVFSKSPSDAGTETAAVDKSAPVTEHARGNVGSYRYSVVSSECTDDLMSWLSTNKFNVPSAAKPAIEFYVKKGWKFFAAKLRHDGGKQAPHPIRLTFPCEQLIYPMVLTSAVGGDLQLDLYIVGKGVAKVPGMRAWGAVRVGPNTVLRSVTAGSGYDRQPWGAPISHPQLASFLAQEGTLTRLRGYFDAGSLHDDLPIQFGAPRRDFRTVVKSREVAVNDAQCFGLIVFGLATILVASITIGVWPKLGAMVVAVVVTAAIGVGAGITTYAQTERIDTEEVMARDHTIWVTDVDSALKSARIGLKAGWSESADEAIGSEFGPSTEDVPGGTIVEKLPRRYRITVYDRVATPTVYEIDAKRLTIMGRKPAK